MKRMILGTVQLGLCYGVNNETGKPCSEDAVKILDYAYKNGIYFLDTASVYGDSESIIGDYIKHSGNEFRICTKLPIQVSENDVLNCFEESRKQLNVNMFYIYYLHRFEQCKSKGILRQLDFLKSRKDIKYIGVSIYEPTELEFIINNLSNIVDVVQLPFSLLDNDRWLYNDLIVKAKDAGIIIYARSIFLQGLILADINSNLCMKKGVSEQLSKLQEIAESLGESMEQLAIDYVNSIDGIEGYLVGCETVDQLKKNIVTYNRKEIIQNNICVAIREISRSMDNHVIDPRKWSD